MKNKISSLFSRIYVRNGKTTNSPHIFQALGLALEQLGRLHYSDLGRRILGYSSLVPRAKPTMKLRSGGEKEQARPEHYGRRGKVHFASNPTGPRKRRSKRGRDLDPDAETYDKLTNASDL